jgi:predicted HTH domain antitoxin
MEGVIQVEFPESLANSLRLNSKDFEKEVKISSLVKLFELGKVSSGTAAKVLGLTRLDFLDLLEKYKVSFLEQIDYDDLMEDIANA